MTAPKGSGGPPPGWCVDEFDSGWSAFLCDHNEPGVEFETEAGAVAWAWEKYRAGYGYAPKPESEPAPPTDGSTLSEKTEASWYLALEESRAEVERLRTDLQTLMSMRDALASDREALRDRVRVLTRLLEQARDFVFIVAESEPYMAPAVASQAQLLCSRIDDALSTTQEPPAKEEP